MALGACGLVLALAFSHGGYYATAWGWSAIVASGLAGLGLARRARGDRELRLGTLEIAVLGSLALLACWVAASSAWGTPARGVPEAQRAVVYIAWLAALLIWVQRDNVDALVGGLWAAIALSCSYGLLTRLLPERLGVVDPIAAARLSEPIGYWNGLGVFTAMGIVLALGLAARAPSPVVRTLAATSLPVCVSTLYFTYSRGAWIALALGLLAAFAVDRRRLQLLATAIALLPSVVIGLLAAYRSDALNRIGAPLAESSQQGHRLLAVLAGASILGALTAIAVQYVERRWTPSPRVRRLAAGSVAVCLATGLVAVFVWAGSPPKVVSRAYHGFAAPSPDAGDRLSGRLFSLSGTGRVTQWRVAWRAFRPNTVLGSGAGTYEQAWNELRPYAVKIRDAHSLYLEMLAELGVIGAALLLVALAAPLLRAREVGAVPIAPVAFGAYAAFLAHAGIDWDWELPCVTLVAIGCSAAVLVAGRREPRVVVSRRKLIACACVAAAIAIVALVGLVGNRALAAADSALRTGDVSRASQQARTGLRWAPWSAHGYRVLGEAQLAAGDLSGARKSFATAVDRDPDDWELWFVLAQVESGRKGQEALVTARRLNPLSPEIDAYLREQAPTS